jgi:hypothetical protein
MSSNKKTAGIVDLSPRKAVTILRILYPAWAVVGMFSIMYVPETLVVPGDAVVTAGNILARETLFRVGVAGSLVTQLIHIVVVLILYQLFRPVNKNMTFFLVVLGLVGVPIAMLNELNQFAALQLLNGADYLAVFEAVQLQALAMLFLNINQQGVIIAGIFWGLWLLPLGLLVSESGYFPKVLGVLLVVAGISYVLDSFTRFFSPNATYLPIVNLLLYGEVVFMLWVVLRGAKLPAIKS